MQTLELEVSASPGAVAGSRADISLANHKNLGYYGELSVGTPGQRLFVLFDTGSAHSWVSSNVSGRTRSFDAERSSTYLPNPFDDAFNIHYGSGAIRGRWCTDSVTIGEISLRNYTFGLGDMTEGIDGRPFDGIIGLGFRRVRGEVKIHWKELMKTLVDSGALASPVFGFYFGDHAPGQLVLGGVDEQHVVGNFTWANVHRNCYWWGCSTPSYWGVHLDGVSLGETVVASQHRWQNVMVDSGVSCLMGPRGQVGSIAQMLNITY